MCVPGRMFTPSVWFRLPPYKSVRYWVYCPCRVLHPHDLALSNRKFALLDLFHSPPLTPAPLATTDLFSLCPWFCFILFVCWLFGVDMKVNNVVLAFLRWLISLSITPFRSLHVVTKGKIALFLWPSNDPLCVITTVSLPTHPLMDT